MSFMVKKQLDAIYEMAATANICESNASNIARKTGEMACSNSVSSKEELFLVHTAIIECFRRCLQLLYYL